MQLAKRKLKRISMQQVASRRIVQAGCYAYIPKYAHVLKVEVEIECAPFS